MPFALKERTDYNYNTTLFRFALKDASATPELPVSSCVLTSFKGEDGKDVIRPYTPINQHEKGVLNLLIKVYAQGKMSKHIHELKVGDELLVKGPMKKKPYVPNTLEQLVLIAGGTGLTPMLQLVDQIFSNPADKTKILLLFANSSPKDVLLREKIDAYSKEHADQFRCVYVVDKNEEKVDWIQETGHITRAMLDKYLPKPDLGDKVSVDGQAFGCSCRSDAARAERSWTLSSFDGAGLWCAC